MKTSILLFCLLAFSISAFTQHTLTPQSLRSIGGPGASVEVLDNATDEAGNQFVCGYFSGTNVLFGNGKTANSNTGSRDIFIARYNESDVCQWVISLGGSENLDQGHSIAVLPDGGIVVAGDIYGTSVNMNPLGPDLHLDAGFQSLGQPAAGFFLARYNYYGQCDWAIIPKDRDNSLNANQIKRNELLNLKQVAVDVSGNILLGGGLVNNRTDFDPGINQSPLVLSGLGGTFVARYTSGGSFLSITQILTGGSWSNVNRMVAARFQGQEAIFLTGGKTASPGSYLAKVDPGNGTLDWINANLGDQYTQRTCLASDASGHVYFSGNRSGQPPVLKKFNWAGDLLSEGSVSTHVDLVWNKVDGFLYGIGASNSTFFQQAPLHIETIDPNSVLVAGKTSFGAPVLGQFSTLSVLPSGQVLIGGSFSSTSFSLGAASVSRQGSQDGFFGRVSICSTPTLSEITGPAYNVCSGSSQTYKINPVAGATSYQWLVPSGWSITTGAGSNEIQVLVGVNLPPQNKSIQVRAITNCASTSYASKLIVPYLQPPTIAGEGNGTEVCPSSSITFSVNEVEGANSYAWSLPAGWSFEGPSSGSTIQVRTDSWVNPNNPSFIQQVKVTALGSCQNSEEVARDVYRRYAAPFGFLGISGVPDLNVVCIDEPKTFFIRPFRQDGIITTAGLTIKSDESILPAGWVQEVIGGGSVGQSDNWALKLTAAGLGVANLKLRLENTCGSVEKTFFFKAEASVFRYFDADGDGRGDPNSGMLICNPGSNWVENDLDCNDADPSVFQPVAWWPDLDGDGYGDQNATSVVSCFNPGLPPSPFVRNRFDCNDNSDQEYNSVWYLDADLDGFGDPNQSISSCSNPSTPEAKYVRNRRDCDDTNAMVNPFQLEDNSDGIDNNCNNFIDEGFDFEGVTYADMDGDFAGSGMPIPPGGLRVLKNGVPVILTTGVSNNSDCDDSNADINPLAVEFPDGSDNDCNGLVDDTLSVFTSTWYLDSDADGYGNALHPIQATVQPGGYVLSADDCDDSNPNVNPGAAEICGNQIDDNCNGQTDENSPQVNAGPDRTFTTGQGTILLTGSPSGGVWSGSGVNAAGQFSTNLPAGVYTLTYSISNPCLVVDQVVITLQSPSGSVGIPAANPLPGNYSGPQTVVLSCPDPQATIYYTLTGNTPLLSPFPNSFTKIYTGPISVIKNTSIRAVAARNGFVTSPVLVANYSISEGLVVENPVVSPGSGNYSSIQTIQLSTQTPGATIFYTTNGNNPVPGGGTGFTFLYTQPFTVSQATTIRAIAVKPGLQNSGISVATITFSAPQICAAPEVLPGSGTFSSAQQIVLSTSTPDATILYTTNGNLPVAGTSFTRTYSQPFLVTSSSTIRAMAVRSGLENSPITRADLVITSPTAQVVRPEITPGTGNYSSPQWVSLNCQTPGATIYYTTNGNVPVTDVPNGFTRIYSGPFLVSTSSTIRAMAKAPGMLNSAVAVAQLSFSGAGRINVDSPKDQSQWEIDLFPNPNSGSFSLVNLTPGFTEDRQVEIMAVTGLILVSQIWKRTNAELEVRSIGLPPGIYVVKISNSSGQKRLRMIVR